MVANRWCVASVLQGLQPMGVSVRDRVEQLKQQLTRAHGRHPRIVGLAVAYLVVTLGVLVGGGWFLASLYRGLPDEDAIGRIGEMDQATGVFDAADQLAFTIFKEQRIEVPLDQMSPNLVHAIVAVEDQRFFEHHGFDLVRIASAALANIRHGRVAQGGSTITQQLARQSFLTPDKTVHRKLQELLLAERIERRYSKQQILELYLNKVYFGDGLHGVEAASRGYFGKHASQLTVAEAALLAGLVKSPSTYAPTVSLQRATGRRNVVLQAMLETGAIDKAAWQQAHATKVALHDTLRESEPHGQYFKEQVRRELVDRFGWQRVYQGGLRVFTTIDLPLQIAAEAAVEASLKSLDERRAALAKRGKKAPAPINEDPLQAALVALDPKPATCARWWAAATSTRAISTALFRRAGSPAPPLSRSCTRRRSKQGYTPRRSSTA